MDDASRMILAGGEFSEATAQAAITTLEAARRRAETWGLEIRELNTDRDAQFFANKGEVPSSAPPSSVGIWRPGASAMSSAA
jgi:hypothetical protein